ncbi:hypothetical protein JCM10213_008320 [Rhodosporidiobolus nylandii]
MSNPAEDPKFKSWLENPTQRVWVRNSRDYRLVEVHRIGDSDAPIKFVDSQRGEARPLLHGAENRELVDKQRLWRQKKTILVNGRDNETIPPRVLGPVGYNVLGIDLTPVLFASIDNWMLIFDAQDIMQLLQNVRKQHGPDGEPDIAKDFARFLLLHGLISPTSTDWTPRADDVAPWLRITFPFAVVVLRYLYDHYAALISGEMGSHGWTNFVARFGFRVPRTTFTPDRRGRLLSYFNEERDRLEPVMTTAEFILAIREWREIRNSHIPHPDEIGVALTTPPAALGPPQHHSRPFPQANTPPSSSSAFHPVAPLSDEPIPQVFRSDTGSSSQQERGRQGSFTQTARVFAKKGLRKLRKEDPQE